MTTERQRRILAKLFRRTGRTFQTLARESGLGAVPDHLNELTEDQAQLIIDTHRGWLRSFNE